MNSHTHTHTHTHTDYPKSLEPGDMELGMVNFTAGRTTKDRAVGLAAGSPRCATLSPTFRQSYCEN
jgi:hypothetical protein